MEALEQCYREFTDLLPEEELHELALKYGAAEQRERKLPIRIFFWLMVLSAGQSTVRGAVPIGSLFCGGDHTVVPRWPGFQSE